jgi:hypothetical protein
VGALERDEWLRAAWRALVAREADPKRLVFVDEMGTHTSLPPCKVPRNRGKNTTLLASMSAEGMGPSLAVTGAVDAQVFEAYLERVLLPELPPGRILVMETTSPPTRPRRSGSWSRREAASSLVPAALLAELRPHRGSLRQDLKGLLLRKAEARTREAMIEAMDPAISSVTEEDARACFEHCG